MYQIKDYIKKIDLFGIPITVLNSEKEKKYQTLFGGLISIFMSTISLLYFIYIIYLWNNNQIAPNLSTRQETNSYEEFEWQTPIIEFRLQDLDYKINPFTEKNNIITPLLFIVEDRFITSKPIALFSEKQEDQITVSINNGTLVLNNINQGNDEMKPMTQFLLVFSICQAQFMTETSYCADNKTIEEYLSIYHGLLFLKINLNQLNLQTQKIDEFSKYYYTAFLPDQQTYSQVMLKQSKTIIDDGILFNNLNQYKFLNNYELINQQVNNKFISNIVNLSSNGTFIMEGFSAYLFRIDNISVIEEVVMPKLGQVLASIGSIVQIIFLLKYLVLVYNEKQLDQNLYHDIISMYYPEFKKIKSQRQFNSHYVNNSDSETNLKEKYNYLIRQAKNKCKFDNILYEISRIQFILQGQFGIQMLLSSHELGGKFFQNECEEIQNMKDSSKLEGQHLGQVSPKSQENQCFDPIEMLQKQS